ncbi:MAG: M6 family metalloprotease domain-containing protein [Paludibacteraceae bacterium]|nr:M6 family metalloprotease domain-containing protein [Paludibacteraceae bacterium]
MRNRLFTTVIAFLFSSLFVMLHAVPAYPGWQTKEQPDGTRIELRLVGDEFYHYWVNRAGEQMVKNEEGYWEVESQKSKVESQKSSVESQRRRAQVNESRQKRAAVIRKDVGKGVTTMTKGVIILVNFSDVSFKSANNKTAYVNMLTDDSYAYNSTYPGSAHKYFYEQSNGKYNPTFDVYGPVTLDNPRSYYGQNVNEKGKPDESGDDKQPELMIRDACQKADASIDFSKYDLNNDGEVDFVYVFYAGNGEADSDVTDAVWPHAWELYSSGGISQMCDGKRINLYACSSELNTENKRAGIATFCHEFSHVLGLPDYYDIDYGANYQNGITPMEWTLMDGGSYNGDGYCPPNYSIYDKYYMGWATPTNLHTPQNVTITTGYSDGYQINANGSLAAYNNTNTQYYLENRQLSGWDKALPGHGLLVWKVMFNQTAWNNNGPNDTNGTIRYGVLCADGAHSYNSQYDYWYADDGDTYPGTTSKTSINTSAPFTTYPITNIAEKNGNITFKFMGGETVSYTLTWMADGTQIAQTTSGSTLSVHASPGDCSGTGGKKFMGWTTATSVPSNGEGIVYAKNGDAVTGNTTYYAVYATESSSAPIRKAGAEKGTILWAENFAHFGTNTPSTAGTGTGTTIYNSATISYSQNDNGTKGYNEALAGGTAPELLLKSGKTWTISGIPTGGAEDVTLTYKSNNTKSSVTCSTTGTSVSGSTKSYTITTKDESTITLVFNCTGNTRLDDIVLKVKTAGSGSSATYSNYSLACEDCNLKPVTNLQVNSVTGNSVTLSWTAPTSTSGISKLQIVDASDNSVKVDNVSTSATSTNITGLTECTEYTFKIASVGSCTKYSETITVQPFSGAKTVTFDYNGNGQSNTQVSTSCGATSVTLPTPTAWAHHTCEGWFTAATDGIKVGEVGGSYTPTANITLYAHWTEETQHTATFYNMGEVYGTSQSLYEGESITKPGTNPEACTGYTFLGWAAAEYTGTSAPSYVSFPQTIGTSDVSYYAVYGHGNAASNVYERITAVSQLTNGVSCVLIQYYDDKAINTSAGVTSKTASTTITSPDAAIKWTLEKDGDNYKFKNSSSEYLSVSSTANGTTIGLDETYQTWTIVTDRGGYSNCFNLRVEGKELEYYSGAFKLYTWSSSFKNSYPFYIYIPQSSYSSYTTSPVCKEIDHIAVTTPPTTTTYTEGEVFSPTGMVVAVYYTDGTSATVSDYTYSPMGALTTTDTQITISYGGKETTQTITVNPIPTYAIHWYVNGVSIKDDNQQVNTKLNTLEQPTNPADDALPCSDKFIGWSQTNLGSALGQEAPDDLFTDITKLEDDQLLTEDVSFYAVYATSGGAGAGTSISTFATGDYLMIDTYDGHYYAMSGNGKTVSSVDISAAVNDNGDGTISVNASSSVITDAMLYTIGGNALAATVYNIKNGKNVQGGSSTDFTQQTSNAWTVTAKNGRFAFVYDTRGILYRDGSDFRNYSTSNRGNSGYGTGYLYLVPTTGFEDYVTSCGKSLSINPKTLTAERPFSGTGTLTATANLYTPTSYTWTTSDASVATVSGSGATATVTYHGTGICTITCSAPDGSTPMTATAKVTVPTAYKVTWDVAGSETEEYYLPTENPVMPANPADVCGSKVFVGWTTTVISTEQAEAPTILYTSQSDFTTKAEATYYAVFADEDLSSSMSFELINYDEELTTANYVIDGYDNPTDYALGNNINASGKIEGTEVTDNSGVITLSSGQESLIWTITRDADNYVTFKNKATNQYLNIVENGSYGKLELGALNEPASYYSYTITDNGSKANSWIFKSNNIVGQQLENYQGTFQAYNNQSAKIYIYKQKIGYTNYTTVCGPTIRVESCGYVVSSKDVKIKSGNVAVTGNNLGAASGLSVTRTAGSAAWSATISNGTVTDGETNNAYLNIYYQPSSYQTTESATFEIKDNLNQAMATITVTGISLPQRFVIASKVDDQWYSLPGDLDLYAPYSGVPTQMNNNNNPTAVTRVDMTACYTINALNDPASIDYKSLIVASESVGALCASKSVDERGIRNFANTTVTAQSVSGQWSITTLDGVNFSFTSAGRSALLRYNRSGNMLWGMYASGTEQFRIVPITNETEACVFLREPMELKSTTVSSNSATLRFKVIPNATGYEYSTDNGTSWFDVSSAAVDLSDSHYMTVLISGLTASTQVTIALRAKADGELCSTPEYRTVTITTSDCDDVPTLDGVSASATSAVISWTCEAATATIVFYTDEDCTDEITALKQTGVSSPCTVSGLEKNTTYYYKVLAGGSCASAKGHFTTETPDISIAEWNPNYIDVNLNIEGTPAVVIQQQVTTGSGEDNVADDIFFSKYYEAKANLKLLGIYNGTKDSVSLAGMKIAYIKVAETDNGKSRGDVGWNLDCSKSNSMALDISPLGKIPPRTEYIFYTITDQESSIASCIQDAVGWDKTNWYPTNTSSASVITELGVTTSCPFAGKGENSSIGMPLQFNGTHAVSLWRIMGRDTVLIDLIGQGDATKANGDNIVKAPTGCVQYRGESRCGTELNDDYGWYCPDGIDYATKDSSALSTNRFLLIRKNIVRAGYSTPNQVASMSAAGFDTESAVASNGDNFNTLCTEWEGRAIGRFSDKDEDLVTTCENFGLVSDFNYSNYYTSFQSITDTMEIGTPNPDGTYRIGLEKLDTLSCQPLKIKVFESTSTDMAVLEREFSVPIMIKTNTTTDSHYFDRWFNGSTTITDSVRTEEECKSCDVVILDNYTLTKAEKVPELRNITVYPNAQLKIDGSNTLAANSITFRRQNDAVPSAYLKDNASLTLAATDQVKVNFRMDAKNWYWITLPYTVNIDDVKYAEGTDAIYGVDWLLKYYDGAERAATKTGGWKEVPNHSTLNPGEGYILCLSGDPNNTECMRELTFPMKGYSEEGTKNVSVTNWGEDKKDPADYSHIQNDELTPNHKGWQLVGNPYFAYDAHNNLTGIPIMQGGLNQVDANEGALHTYQRQGSTPYITVTNDHGATYTQVMASSLNLPPFTSYFVQVGVGDGTSIQTVEEKSLSFAADKRQTAAPSPARRMAQLAEEGDEWQERQPVYVGLVMTASNGEKDETALAVHDDFSAQLYEMGADLMKWKGTNYKYYKKPVLYTMAGTQERSFNALSSHEANQMTPVGYFAYSVGEYTIRLNDVYAGDLGNVEEVVLYDAQTGVYTDLLNSSYTFSTSVKKEEKSNRLFLTVKVSAKTDITTGMEHLSTIKDGIYKFITPDGQLHIARDGVIYDAQGRVENVVK